MNSSQVVGGLLLGAAVLYGSNKLFKRVKNGSIFHPDKQNVTYDLPKNAKETLVRTTEYPSSTGGSTVHTVWNGALDNSRKVILYSHGNAGNVGSRLDILAYWDDLGFDCVLYDYSGFGKSSGSPSEDQTYADARAVWNWLTTDKGVQANNVVLFGNSLGGAVTLYLTNYLAKFKTKPHAIVLQSTFVNAAQFSPNIVGSLITEYRNDSYISKLEEQRIMIIHSEEDTMIPISSAIELLELASRNGTNAIHFFPAKGDHNNLEMNNDYTTALLNFIKSN